MNGIDPDPVPHVHPVVSSICEFLARPQKTRTDVASDMLNRCRIRVSSVAKVLDEQRRFVSTTYDLGVGPLLTGFTGSTGSIRLLSILFILSISVFLI